MGYRDSATHSSDRRTRASWVFGAFTFRVLPSALTRDGRRRALRPQTARLLELLVRNPGRLVDREMIRRHIWGSDTFVEFETSINFAVRDLRRVLGDSARAPKFIETVHGQGYRFACPVREVVEGPAGPRGQVHLRRALVFCGAALSFLVIAGHLSGKSSSPRGEIAFATPEDLSGSWAGSASIRGHEVLVQLQIDRASGSLEVFGEAPLSFDGRFLEMGIEVLAGDGSELRLLGASNGEAMEIVGAGVGGVFGGTISGGGELRCLRLAPLAPEDLQPLVGLYEGDGKRVLVSWREYGGLRAIDLETGRAEALFPLGPSAFLSLAQVTTLDASQPFYRFPQDGAGVVQALVRGEWPSPETLSRTSSVVQQQVNFTSGGTQLAGTLLAPPAGVRLPAAVLVHGSGPIYRSALLERALWLVERGVAAFVYDKRGTGASGGDRRGDDFEILTADVEAAIDAVRKLTRVDPDRVGLYGHSQAGYLIPRVAANDPRLAFAIVVNGGGIRPGEQTLFDKGNDLEEAGYTGAERERALELMRRTFAYFRDREGDRAALEADYLEAKREPWFPVTDLPDLPGIPPWESPPEQMVAYSRELNFDPVTFQRSMQQPVLVLLAAEDKTVPTDEVAARWRESLEAAGNPRFEVRVLSDVDHGMRLTSGPQEGHLSPEYRLSLGNWLEQVVPPA